MFASVPSQGALKLFILLYSVVEAFISSSVPPRIGNCPSFVGSKVTPHQPFSPAAVPSVIILILNRSPAATANELEVSFAVVATAPAIVAVRV